MTQYYSPLSLLPEGINFGVTPRELKIAKHALLAEFELTGNTTIQAAGSQLTRNDVLKLFDKLEHSNDLEYHALVATDSVLMHFLLHHEIKPGQKFSLSPTQCNEDFIAWISPFFVFAFRKATLRIFRTVNRLEFDTLVVNPKLMTEQDEWQAWAAVELYLQDVAQKFENVLQAQYPAQTLIEKYTHYDLITLLCNLPPARFSEILNDYAFALMQLSITEYNKGQKTRAFELIAYAKSIAVNDTLQRQVADKEAEMLKLQRSEKRAKNKETFWTVFKVTLFVLYALTRIASCAD